MKFLKSLFGFSPLVLYLAIMIFVAIATELLKVFFMNGDEENSVLTLISTGFLDLLTIAVAGLWYKAQFAYKTNKENIRKCFNKKSIPSFCVIPVGIYFVVAACLLIAADLFPSQVMEYGDHMKESGVAASTVISTLITVFIGPIAEELIFRGLVINLFKKAGWRVWPAIIVSAAMFGISHLQPLQSCYTFFVGIIFGFTFYRYGSIIPSMLMHILFNFFGSFWLDVLVSMNAPDWVFYAMGPVGILLVIGGLILINKDSFTKSRPAKWKEERAGILAGFSKKKVMAAE